MSFWENLKKPIFVLAPMEDVTDTVFRQIIISCGRPDVFFTEFTNTDGMFSRGEKQVTQRLQFLPVEKPIVAQIWGMNPENYYKAAKQLRDMGYDGIDINMGCPQRHITSKGACSALIKNHQLAKEIILATREGAQGLPVSVKTRIGFKTIQTEEWIGFLLSLDLPVLTVHGRTAAEMSAVPAHWDEIGKVVRMRDEMEKDTLIIGNGDVQSVGEGRQKVKEFGVDGVMIGRGVFHNPWVFNGMVKPEEKSVLERLTLLQKHVDLYEQTWNGKKPFQILKKYFKIYVSGFEGAADMRMKLMEARNSEEVSKLIKNYELQMTNQT